MLTLSLPYSHASIMKALSVYPHILDYLASLQRNSCAAAVSGSAHVKGKSKTERTRRKKKPALPSEALRQALAHETVRCTALYITGQQNDLTTHSAAFLEALMTLWAERGIHAEDVWREIDHRIQLGNLLMQINQDTPQKPAVKRRFWRPSSTKLP